MEKEAGGSDGLKKRFFFHDFLLLSFCTMFHPFFFVCFIFLFHFFPCQPYMYCEKRRRKSINCNVNVSNSGVAVVAE